MVGFGFRNEWVFFVGAAGEDAGKGVIVFLSKGIVLMIVATGAGKGYAQHAATDHVDAIMTFVGAGLRRLGDAVIPGPKASEAQPADGGGILREIAGKLGDEEAVVREVAIDGVDDPIAIPPGIGIRLDGGAGEVVFAVAGDVEPVAAPMFAVVLRGEQFVDEAFLPAGFGVLDDR